MEKMPILALMYDFDHTLSPRDMQEYAFIPELNMESDDFWALCRSAGNRYRMDPILAYMYVMLQEAKKRGMTLTRDTFTQQGAHVELFDGLDTWFQRVNDYGASLGFKVEHYVLSSGQKEIIEGTPIANQFKMIYAAEFVYDDHTGEPVWPAMAVNYTNKTQFIYRINKGVLDVSDDKTLNDSMPDDSKRVPFTNMVYMGDGLSDVPCMKMMRAYGGQAIAVYQEDNRLGVEDLMAKSRVDFIFPADYSEGTALDTTVKNIIRKMSITDRLWEETAQQLRSIGGDVLPNQVGLF